MRVGTQFGNLMIGAFGVILISDDFNVKDKQGDLKRYKEKLRQGSSCYDHAEG